MAAIAAPPTEHRAPAAARVLIVDDEEAQRTMYRYALADHVAALSLAATIPEALDELRRGVAVLVTDYRLGMGATGIDLLERAREIAPDAVGIVVTAYEGELFQGAGVQRALELARAGVLFDYFAKPVDLEERLVPAIGRAQREHERRVEQARHHRAAFTVCERVIQKIKAARAAAERLGGLP